MICVYPANCTDFSSNGLGVVTPMSCTVTETLNGEWELTLVHDIDERGKWTRLSEDCILRAPVPAAMTPRVDLVTQQYQTSTYDVQIYKITTKSGPLRLRSGTGTNYRILGKYKKGREVIVLNKTTSSWYEVTAPDGKHGYMASQYLTFQRTETQTVQTNVGFRNQVIEVLGTEFNVSGYKDEVHVYTTLVNGKVKVATTGRDMTLLPGEQCVLDTGDGSMIRQQVDVDKIIGWKKGKFILEEQTLEQIMQKLARWYDITVFYQNPALKNKVFKGSVPRDAELQQVLNILEKTGEVQFHIQNRTVIVKE